MIQLKVISGRMAGTEKVTRHFPFTVGRGTSADLQIEEPGVWDKHFEIFLEGSSFFLATTPEATVAVSGQPAQRVPLKNGDIIEFGLTKIRFGLTPNQPRSTILRESVMWTALVLLCLGQVALIYWLST